MWEQRAGVPLTDPNFKFHLQQALSSEDEAVYKQALADLGLNKKIIPIGQKLSLHKPNPARVVYGEGDTN